MMIEEKARKEFEPMPHNKMKMGGDFADYHNAGYVATTMLITSLISLLVATVFQVRAMIGHSQNA